MRSPLLVTVPLLGLLAACGGSSASSGGAGGADIAISSGDATCEVATTSLTAGKHTFAVRNTGGDVTEVYVYGKGSSGKFDKVVGEVENIAPQTSRDFPVTLSGGEYQVACKPGQKGDGIRTTITVAGPTASAADAAYDREVAVTAKEYAFSGLEGFTAKVGEKIEFVLHNQGTTQHELEILGPDGKNIGEVGPTDAGANGKVVIALTVPGTYTYLCGLADHASRGMKGTFTVA
jgi:plastocyanin